MGRRKRVVAHSRSEAAIAAPASVCDSSKPIQSEASPARFERIDAALLALLLVINLSLVVRLGFKWGTELMPWPDALEYSAVAVNLDHGLGPVLHFGGNSYPSRYTLGFPLILAAANPLLGDKPQRLYLVTVFMAAIAIVAFYFLTRWVFDRWSAFFATLLMATSPLFGIMSTRVMSDVPTLAVLLLTAISLLYAIKSGKQWPWLVCGILAGFSAIIRPTNVLIVVAIGAAALAAPPPRKVSAAAAFFLGFVLFPAFQAGENYLRLGSPFTSGYSFWDPEQYRSFLTPFSVRYLFQPGSEGNTRGNLVSYVAALLGVDGWFGNRWGGVAGRGGIGYDVYYSFYPLAALPFVILGAWYTRQGLDSLKKAAAWFGASFLAVLLITYLPYYYTAVAFLLPGAFVLFACAGYGIVQANRRAEGRARTAIIALDVILAGSLIAALSLGLAAEPESSQMVRDLEAIRPQLRNSILVSDSSLQFLELYEAGTGAEFIALNDLEPEEFYQEYHLAFLLYKRQEGQHVHLPPILFDDTTPNPAVLSKLIRRSHEGTPVFVLVLSPTPKRKESTVKELDLLEAYFSREVVLDTEAFALIRLRPR